MRFGIRALSVLFFLQAVAACGTPEESSEDMSVTCPAGESVNPVTGMCMPPRMDMAGVDMPSTMQDSGMVQSDMSPEDMSADMGCEEGKVLNPITGQCVEQSSDDMGGPSDMSADLGDEDMAVDMTPEDMGGEFGVLFGSVTRSTSPQNGGVGPVFVALFEKNPVTAGGSDPGLVAFDRIENVDFNPEGVMVPFRLEAIPPRAEQYYIVAFLDDNMSADTSAPESAGPDRGDLLSLDGIGPVTVTVSAPGQMMLDLDLNFSMIF